MPTAAFARGAGAPPGRGRARGGGGRGRGRGAPAPPAEDRLGAPNARLPRGAAAALEGLDSRKLARLTGAQLQTVVLHLLRIAVKHRSERALRHGEALEALEARRRQARARGQRAVQRQLASRGGGPQGLGGFSTPSASVPPCACKPWREGRPHGYGCSFSGRNWPGGLPSTTSAHGSHLGGRAPRREAVRLRPPNSPPRRPRWFRRAVPAVR